MKKFYNNANLITNIFKTFALYEYRDFRGPSRRTYAIVFAKDLVRGQKCETTTSWRKAKKWVEAAHNVVAIGFNPVTGEEEATCGVIKDYDEETRWVWFAHGELRYIGRCRTNQKLR